jgi:hypothetical protein
MTREHVQFLVGAIQRFHAEHHGMPGEIQCHLPKCPVCGDFHDWVTWTMTGCELEGPGGKFTYSTACPNRSPMVKVAENVRVVPDEG